MSGGGSYPWRGGQTAIGDACEENTSDLCFGVRKLVAFCSQGQTLQKGSLIMTGTPGGVALFMKPQRFLQDGDEVTVEIGGIGRVSNQMPRYLLKSRYQVA